MNGLAPASTLSSTWWPDLASLTYPGGDGRQTRAMQDPEADEDNLGPDDDDDEDDDSPPEVGLDDD